MPTITRIFVNAGAIAIAVALQAPCASAQTAKDAKPTIVLVHGAFADGSSWQRVIPILQRDGYTVIAVQNPLTSLAADVETTKRVVDAQTGSVVLVGHSYGGAVITEAAAGSANVKALVYIGADRRLRRQVSHFARHRPQARRSRISVHRPRTVPRPLRRGRPPGGNECGGRHAKANHRQRVRRVRGPRGVEDHSLLVPGERGRSGHQSRARAVLRQAHGSEDDRNQVEPRPVPLTSRRSGAIDRASGGRRDGNEGRDRGRKAVAQ